MIINAKKEIRYFLISRKFLLTALLSLWTVDCATAAGIKLGIGAGLNIATQSASVPVGSSIITASREGSAKFAGGIDLDMSLVDWFSIDPGILYLGKGNDSITYNYIEFPVLGNFKIGTDMARVILQLGPSLGVRVSESVGAFSLTSTDFSLQFGLGGELSLASVDLFLNARYLLGISNSLETSIANLSVKNNGFLILAGIKFPLA